jgi:hypothetical protein
MIVLTQPFSSVVGTPGREGFARPCGAGITGKKFFPHRNVDWWGWVNRFLTTTDTKDTTA